MLLEFDPDPFVSDGTLNELIPSQNTRRGRTNEGGIVYSGLEMMQTCAEGFYSG